MDEHVVFQFEDENRHKYLSIYSPEFQFCRSHILPIKTERQLVYGNCCRGLYFFTNHFKDFVVCNLSNLESKALTLSNLVEPPPNLAIFHACGIGQDPDSGLFKVVFTYNQHFSREEEDDEVYLGVENRALLYCLDTDSFKRINIKCPDFMANPDDNVYVGHKRYWTAMMIGISNKAQFGPSFIERHVVSFNFQTEEFNYFSLPPYPNKDYKFNIVEYGASLGAVGYSSYNQFDKFDIWVNQEKLWTRIHCFHIGSSVAKVLALKEERFVMLEVRCEDDNSHSEVHVYDIVRDRVMVILDTRGRRGSLRIFSYVESRCRLSDGERMISSYADVKDEEVNKMEAGEKKKKKKNKKKKKKKTAKKLGDDESEEVEEKMIWKKNDKKKKKKKKTSSKMHEDEDVEEVWRRVASTLRLR